MTTPENKRIRKINVLGIYRREIVHQAKIIERLLGYDRKSIDDEDVIQAAEEMIQRHLQTIKDLEIELEG